MGVWSPVEKAATTGGAPTPAGSRVLIIACGALARELRALIEINGLDHVALTCLPANLHLYPKRIPDAVRDAIRQARPDYDTILVGYADCGTGGRLDAVIDEEGVARLPGAHCYAFYSGVETFAAREETDLTCFYLTDFLVRQFDTFVIKPLGLDRHPELRDQYFGHYERLVYLAQTEDPALDAAASDAARRLGLAYERRQTGYGDLDGIMAAL